MRRAFGSIALVMGAVLMVLTPAVALAQTQEPYSGASVTTTSVASEVLGTTVQAEGLPRTGLEVGDLALWSIVILLLGIGILWAVGRLRAGS